MTPALPFLYLPDAVTLVLLMLVLDALRRVAVLHIRQELIIIRKEMLAARLAGGPIGIDPGYVALRGLVDSSIALAPRLSPARLLFLYRLLRKSAKRGSPVPVSDSAREAWEHIEGGADRERRERLRRLHAEMSLSLGSFFLMASLSGWVLLLAAVPGMIKRSVVHHANYRTDVFFDMAERLLGRLGRHAQKVGALTEQPPL